MPAESGTGEVILVMQVSEMYWPMYRIIVNNRALRQAADLHEVRDTPAARIPCPVWGTNP